ncbi:beta-galactosidase [Paenibacillus hodogayensis]|uniref:Beta-galactosidase n=1 Tax=Paenibacillus hodogayensis TaxID=279208 RepID=A0ABV5VYX5_9BACL
MIDPANKLLREQGSGIPIGLWVPPPNRELTEDRYKEVKEAGFTFVLGLSEYDGTTAFIRKALDAAHANGLLYLVRDPRLTELADDELSLVEPYVAEFAGHPAYAGHLFIDEPDMSLFPKLRALKAAYGKAAPHGLAYVNLFPTYASDRQRGGDHEQYVSGFLEQFEPAVLSYDHYPFLTPKPGRTHTITQDYYTNLRIVSEAARARNIPFWLFIQTLAFNRSNRDPLEAEIRWQVYTSLAYGAKGIQYFTYWTPDDGGETFGDAMIDRAGGKTRHYGEVQRINRDISLIGGVLAQLEPFGVLAHGSISPPLEGALKSFAPIGRIEGDAAVIGCFRDREGQPYALVVNESFTQPGSVRIGLDDSAQAAAVWEDGQKTALRLDQGEFALHLDPGEGKLIAFGV